MKFFSRVGILLLLLFFAGCYTSINTINRNPQYFKNQKVKIRGFVRASVGLENIKVIYVQDGSHNFIPVITKKHIPPKGKLITVKGTVSLDYPVSSKDTFDIVIIQSPKKTRRKFRIKRKYRYLSRRDFKPKDNPYFIDPKS